jgi:hypothetical protein
MPDIDLNRCPNCGRFVGINPDGYYDTAERGADPDSTPVAAFCDERCACVFHGRPVPDVFWKPHREAA